MPPTAQGFPDGWAPRSGPRHSPGLRSVSPVRPTCPSSLTAADLLRARREVGGAGAPGPAARPFAPLPRSPCSPGPHSTALTSRRPTTTGLLSPLPAWLQPSWLPPAAIAPFWSSSLLRADQPQSKARHCRQEKQPPPNPASPPRPRPPPRAAAALSPAPLPPRPWRSAAEQARPGLALPLASGGRAAALTSRCRAGLRSPPTVGRARRPRASPALGPRGGGPAAL